MAHLCSKLEVCVGASCMFVSIALDKSCSVSTSQVYLINYPQAIVKPTLSVEWMLEWMLKTAAVRRVRASESAVQRTRSSVDRVKDAQYASSLSALWIQNLATRP